MCGDMMVVASVCHVSASTQHQLVMLLLLVVTIPNITLILKCRYKATVVCLCVWLILNSNIIELLCMFVNINVSILLVNEQGIFDVK